MINRKSIIKALMMGMCVSVLSTGVAFAETTNSQPKDDSLMYTSEIAPDNSDTSVAIEQVDEKLMVKQEEVDKYLFNDHIEELEEMGITVTHTVPLDEYVEIGILPFTQENVDYIYEVLGVDLIKVVEGQEVELMATTGIVSDTPETTAATDDTTVTDDTTATDDAVTTTVVDDATVTTTADDTAVTTTEADDALETTTVIDDSKDTPIEEDDTKSNSPIIIICIAGAVVLLGGVILAQRNKQLKK